MDLIDLSSFFSWCSSSRSIPCLSLVLFLGCMTGCTNTGYHIDERRGTVVWKFANEAHGIGQLPIPEADASTFQVLELIQIDNDFVIGVDKNNVYLKTKVIQNASPDSFQHMASKFFVDKDSVFYWDENIQSFFYLENSDPEYFEIIYDPAWSRSRDIFYYFYLDLSPYDPDNFVVLPGELWGRDGVSYYFGSREVLGEDYESFRLIESWSQFARDDIHLFWRGWRIDNVDISSFKIVNNSKIIDNFNEIGLRTKTIEGDQQLKIELKPRE